MKRNDGMQIVILVLLLLAHLSAGGAWAEDPKAAARAIGEAGRAAAAAVAKNPGFRRPCARLRRDEPPREGPGRR